MNDVAHILHLHFKWIFSHYCKDCWMNISKMFSEFELDMEMFAPWPLPGCLQQATLADVFVRVASVSLTLKNVN